MTKVVVDDTLAAQFLDPRACVELCDKSGRVLGHFYPLDENDDELYASYTSPFSDEELDLREKETGGRSLAEFWQQIDPK